MRHVVVRYRVRPDRLAEHETKLRAVFDALEREPRAGLRYTALRLADGVSFVHLALVSTTDASNALTSLPAFRAFVADIAERCDEPPVSTDASAVGHFEGALRDG